jgi:hypothetical protein
MGNQVENLCRHPNVYSITKNGSSDISNAMQGASNLWL